MEDHPERVINRFLVTAIDIDGKYWDPLEGEIVGCGVVNGRHAAEFEHTEEIRIYNGAVDEEMLQWILFEHFYTFPWSLSFDVF